MSIRVYNNKKRGWIEIDIRTTTPEGKIVRERRRSALPHNARMPQKSGGCPKSQETEGGDNRSAASYNLSNPCVRRCVRC